jgi:hypothetical protein
MGPDDPLAGSDDDSAALTDRERAIEELRAVRDQARYKVFGDGRIRDTDKEDIRIKYLRLMVQSANAERRLINDRELDDLAAEIADLRERLDGHPGDSTASDDLLADGGRE